MDLITQTLANTFAGQATTQAATFQGQIDRVTLAADNLKEAFGKGFLGTFARSQEATNDMVEEMRNLETSMETAGYLTGEVVKSMAGDLIELSKLFGLLKDPGATLSYILEDVMIDLRGLSKEEKAAAREANNLAYQAAVAGGAIESAGEAAGSSISYWNKLTYAVGMSTDAYAEYVQANTLSRQAIQNANKDYQDLAARQKVVNTFESDAIDLTDELAGSRSRGSTATDKYAKAQNNLSDAFAAQNKIVDDSAQKLSDATAALAEARGAVEEYANAIQTDILSGIDFGKAYTDQFDEAGNLTGESLISGFNKQIEQAELFGSVLNRLKAEGADQSLIEQIASLGPTVGAALGNQLIQDGLVKTMSDKWVNVQSTTNELAMSLVPEFLNAGVESGIQTVDGLSDALSKETTRLGRIGRNIAKPVGARFKAQFLKDIAEAIAEVEAIQTAARAEKVAAAERTQAALTEQAVAQALKNLVSKSDARIGVNAQPVLA